VRDGVVFLAGLLMAASAWALTESRGYSTFGRAGLFWAILLAGASVAAIVCVLDMRRKPPL